MTPYELGILLHYYGHADDHEGLQNNAPIWRPTMDQFIAEDMLSLVPQDRVRHAAYELTERGQAFIEALLHVPFPQQVTQWKIAWPIEQIKESAS